MTQTNPIIIVDETTIIGTAFVVFKAWSSDMLGSTHTYYTYPQPMSQIGTDIDTTPFKNMKAAQRADAVYAAYQERYAVAHALINEHIRVTNRQNLEFFSANGGELVFMETK